MNQRAIRFAAACAMLLSVTAQGAEKRLDKTFTVAPGGKLTVEADGSNIAVSGGDSNQVTVQIVVSGSEKSVDRMVLTAEQDGSGVTVRAKRQAGGWFDWGNWNQNSNVKVVVPRHYNLGMQTSGGDITVSQLQGDAVGRTSGGDVRVTSVQGPVTMTTSGGNMDVSDVTGKTDIRTSGGNIAVRRINGELKADTSGGNISLEQVAGPAVAHTSGGDVIANGVRGAADLQSSGGSIKAQSLDGSIRARTSGGDVRVELVGANRGIEASTTGGSVVLRLPRNVSGTLDAATSGGSVASEIAVTTTEVRERRLSGTLNGGGEKIYARSSGGDVRLQARD